MTLTLHGMPGDMTAITPGSVGPSARRLGQPQPRITAATRAVAAGWLTTLCDQRSSPRPEPCSRSRNDEPLGSPVTSSHHGMCVHLGVALGDRCEGSG